MRKSIRVLLVLLTAPCLFLFLAVPRVFAWSAGPTGYWCDESGKCYYGGGVASSSSSYSSSYSSSSPSYDTYYQAQTASIMANAAVTAMDMIVTKLIQRRRQVLQQRAVQREQYHQLMEQRKAEKEEEDRTRRERQETRREQMREASVNVQNAIGQLEATIQSEFIPHAPLAVDFASRLGTEKPRDAGVPLDDDEIAAIEKEYCDAAAAEQRKIELPVIDPQFFKDGQTPRYSVEESKRIKEYWDRAAARRVEELKAEAELEKVRGVAEEDTAKKIQEWQEDQKWAEGWVKDGAKPDEKFEKYAAERPWLKEPGREEEEIWQGAVKENERRKKEGWPNLSGEELERKWLRQDDPEIAVSPRWPGPLNPEKPLPNPIVEEKKEFESIIGIYESKIEQRNEEKALKALCNWFKANEEDVMRAMAKDFFKEYLKEGQ